MPQLTQIIPAWLHPHIETVINDNTEFEDGARGPSIPTTRSYFVINSDRGRDGQFLKFEDEHTLIREYGTPNFERHGQPIYNAYNFLKNTDVLAYVMRVVAEDATYANTVIAARVKVESEAELDEDGEKIQDGELEVVLTAYNIPDLRSMDDVEMSMRLLSSNSDEEGYMVIPLFALVSTGRGEYGNSYRARVVRDLLADGEIPFANYRVEAYELTDTLRQRDIVSGSMYYDAIAFKKSYYLQDLFDDPEENRGQIKYISFEEGFDKLYDLYMEKVNPDIRVPKGEIDFLYGRLIGDGHEELEGYTLNFDHEDFTILDAPDGIELVGGDDGNFKFERDEEKLMERQSHIDKQYLRAFAGEIDRTILSKRRTPSELFFDAGYSEETKRQIRTLLLHRNDALGYLDSGIINTAQEALSYSDDKYNLGDMVISMQFQHLQVRDPFTHKRITVPYTYFLARDLPRHINERGTDVPYAMEDRTLLTGHIRNSVKPEVDADDLEVKEHLYRNRFNYIESIGDNRYMRGTQSTSKVGTTKNHWSDLNEEHNVRILLLIKREIENLVVSTQYNFARQEDRDRFTFLADLLIRENYEHLLHSFSVRFDMNKFEEQRSILHCYLEISFSPIVKRAIIEIDVNPRS